jgi:hypothetical protein
VTDRHFATDGMAHPTRFERVAYTFGGQRSALAKCADLFAVERKGHVLSATTWAMIARRRAASEPSFDSRSASTRIKSTSSSGISLAESPSFDCAAFPAKAVASSFSTRFAASRTGRVAHARRSRLTGDSRDPGSPR